VVQQYDGEPLNLARVSILRVNGGSDVVVVALDAEELNYSNGDSSTRAHIEMLPGLHEVDVGDLSDPLRRVVTVRFRAEAGKVYRLTLDRVEATASLRAPRVVVWEVDRQSVRTLAVVPPAPEAGTPSASSSPSAPAPTGPAAPGAVVVPGAPAPSVAPSSAPTAPSPQPVGSTPEGAL
jgi:hypothetical protein